MHETQLCRVLLVDDDEILLRQMATAFNAAGFYVLSANRGDAALEAFAAVPADLVVTDIVMPGGNGIETILALGKIASAVRIIAISGGGPGGSRDDLELALQVGADEVMRKPFRLSALVALASEVLSRPVADVG